VIAHWYAGMNIANLVSSRRNVHWYNKIMITRWLLRYAPRFHGKKSLKNSPKKFQKKIPNIFFQKKNPKLQKLLCLNSYAYNGGSACEKLGGLGTLVKEEIENAQTVHKGLAKLLYRL
jgi:hypothetical protein